MFQGHLNFAKPWIKVCTLGAECSLSGKTEWEEREGDGHVHHQSGEYMVSNQEIACLGETSKSCA